MVIKQGCMVHNIEVMSDIYEDWKPLRNYLAKTDLNDSLAVIRVYSVRNMLNAKPPLPSDMQPHPWIDKPHAFLPWELETLAREVIISTENTSSPQRSFKKADDFGHAINDLKRIEKAIAMKYITSNNVIQEVSVRLAHRQFKYQVDGPNLDSLVRYAKIFNHPEVASLVLTKTDLTTRQIATIGGAMFGNFMTHYGAIYPPDMFSMPGVDMDDYEKFVSFFGIDMATLKQLLIDPSERRMDDTFFYAYHSLYNYPIIKTQLTDRTVAYVCPIPTLLHWRITSGLYYDIYAMRNFANAFGDAFEHYVGELLNKTLTGTKNVIYAGEANSSKSPNRSDWLIDQPDEVLLIESKTKRLTMGAKTTLLNDDEMFKQLNILGDAIKQSYLSLKAYKDGAYKSPVYVLDSEKKAFICVTTLERWYLMGEQIQMLHAVVEEKVVAAGLDVSIIKEAPYIVAPITDLEKLAYLAKTYKISEIIEPYLVGVETKGWELGVYMNDEFNSDLKKYDYVFAGELDTVYNSEIAEKLKEHKII